MEGERQVDQLSSGKFRVLQSLELLKKLLEMTDHVFPAKVKKNLPQQKATLLDPLC